VRRARCGDRPEPVINIGCDDQQQQRQPSDDFEITSGAQIMLPRGATLKFGWQSDSNPPFRNEDILLKLHIVGQYLIAIFRKGNSDVYGTLRSSCCCNPGSRRYSLDQPASRSHQAFQRPRCEPVSPWNAAIKSYSRKAIIERKGGCKPRAEKRAHFHTGQLFQPSVAQCTEEYSLVRVSLVVPGDYQPICPSE
jgi:hypothetical protein